MPANKFLKPVDVIHKTMYHIGSLHWSQHSLLALICLVSITRPCTLTCFDTAPDFVILTNTRFPVLPARPCHSVVASALLELSIKSGEWCYWPDPEPPLLLVLDPASDAPVAAVLAEPGASHTVNQSFIGHSFVFCLFVLLSVPLSVQSLSHILLGTDMYSPE